MPETACDGVQVVELGAGSIAASLAGMLLADNGARVVKVEPPTGDRMREQWPSGFLVWNRGKESVVADLRTREGQAETRRLLEVADVVIEAFGVGVAESWGVGYDDLREANPGLVYCSIKGFGAGGAYAHVPAYEGVVAAKTGFFTMGGFGIREGPIFNGAQMASNGAGHMAVGAILAALMVRETSGRGQRIEATLAQGLTAYDYFGTATWQDAQRKAGNARGSSAIASAISGATRTAFLAATADGRWVCFTHMQPHQAQALSRAVGIGHVVDDPRFARQPMFDTPDDAEAWEFMIADALRTKTYAEWEPILLADSNIAFEMARRSEEALDHVQIRHNGNRIVVDDPDLGPVEQVGPVAAFSDTPARVDRTAPRLGEHDGPFHARAMTAPDAFPAHPLSGTTILELGYFFAMPFGLTLAASLGARVIKFETRAGDPMRMGFGLPEVSAAKVLEGKESLAVDLSTPRGQEIAHRLVRTADVFVDGFRPGVADRLDLGADVLRRLNPGMLLVRAGGYGVSGPYAHRPIYAGVASAAAGQIYRHAGYWLDPDLAASLETIEAREVILPRLRGPVDGDTNAALALSTTVMLGLFDRARTGRGQTAATSMLGANALAYADDVNRYRGKPPIPLADPDNYGLHALYRLYRAASGWVFVAATRQKEWEGLAIALGAHGLLEDAQFATPAARLDNDAALAATLGALFATRTAADWEEALVPKGVACVEAFAGTNSEFTCTDPVMRETGLVVEVDHPILGPLLRHGLPVAFSETPGRVAPGPVIGQHTNRILAELDYDDADIARLHADGVVFGD